MATAPQSTNVRTLRTPQTVVHAGRNRRVTGRSGHGTHKQNEEKVRDAVLDALLNSAKTYESKVIAENDPNTVGMSGNFQIEVPPYNLQALATLVDRSNVLRQCIDAYVTNIESTGWALEYIGPEGGEESAPAEAEAERIRALLDDPNGEYSFIEMRERNRRDMESIGAQAIEVVRDPDGTITALYHTPVHTMYLTKRETEATEVTRYAKRNGKHVKIIRDVKFRRIVQQVGTKRTFFKEFGDTRPIDPQTGEVNVALAFEAQATEILYVPLYKSGYTYGVPRYIHQLPSITGSREAELTNLRYFQDNAIPAMVVLLSGGTLTKETYDDLETILTQVRGRDAQNKVLVVEALSDEASASDKGALHPPKLEIKPLGDERQKDGLFQEYDKENQKKVRGAFRLNPLFVGLADDMTYATAKASLEMGEAQVFAPERNKIDDIINMKLLQDPDGKPPLYWWVKSNPPRLVDPQDIINSLEKFEASGAMTPNVAIGIANQLFGLEIEPIIEDWGDIPFAITKAFIEMKGKIKGLEDVLEEELAPDPAPQPFGGDPNNPDGDPNAAPTGEEPPVAPAEAKGYRRPRKPSRAARKRNPVRHAA